MLTCDDAAPLIAREADHALDERDRLALHAHLSECADCRSEVEAQREVAALLRTRPVLEASPRFAAAVAARLDAEVDWFAMPEWRTWTWRLLPVAASLFVVAVFVGGSNSQLSPARSPATTEAGQGVGQGVGRGAGQGAWQAETSDAQDGADPVVSLLTAQGASGRAGARSVFLDANATGDEILLTVLTGSTSSARVSGKDERR
jgi:anti-sigma factor RsiW